MDKSELEDLMKKAEKGDLIREELIPGAKDNLECYTSACNAYEKFKRKDFSLEDTKKVFWHAMHEMIVYQKHEVNSVLVPQLLMLYQGLHTKPKTTGGK